jgi:hypothetical protein
MTITLKWLTALAVTILTAAPGADARQLLVRGPGGYGHASWKSRSMAPHLYARQPPDLGAAIAGALAGAALLLIPRATEALIAKLPAEAPAPPAPPPAVTAQAQDSPRSNDALDDIEGNSRGITRQEVEAALVDWCASHVDAPLCVKLRVTPPPGGPQPVPDSYYLRYSAPGGRGYYRPGRFQTWNGCQQGWTVQDGLCKPFRGY